MKKKKIGIVGCGAIGTDVALFAAEKLGNNVIVEALSDLCDERAVKLKKRLGRKVKILNIDSLARRVDLIVEAASGPAACLLLEKAISLRKDILILSVGGLVDARKLLARAAARRIKVYLPAGAICGIDGLTALSLGGINKVRLTTTKPPAGLKGAAYLKRKGINIDNLKGARVVFRGSVRQAVKYFPRNINVAAILLLASGARDVEVCIKVDAAIKRNTHRIDIDARCARASIEVANLPSPTNPKTSALAILSAQRTLMNIFSSLQIG